MLKRYLIDFILAASHNKINKQTEQFQQYIQFVLSPQQKQKEPRLMKQLPGLHQQYSMIKINSPGSGYGPNLNKASSNKNFMRVAPVKKKEVVPPKKLVQVRQRISRSIEQIPHLQSDDEVPLFGNRRTMPRKQKKGEKSKQILIQNCEQNRQDDDQLFNQSYQKLNKVYHNFQDYNNRTSIEQQLSQVLDLIRLERTNIRNKLQQIQMKKLKKQSSNTTQSGQNTEAIIIDKNEKATRQVETQTEAIENMSESEQVKTNQTYSKLIKILEDMKINSKEILPQDIKMEELKVQGDKKYQQLKESEIITVQKFVIKKLVQRITSLQMETQQS